MNRFFQALPKRLKVALHLIEMILSFYVSTALMLMGTPLGVHLAKYLPVIAVSFLIAYPPVRLLIQFVKGVPGTSPDDVDPLSGTPPGAIKRPTVQPPPTYAK